MLLKCSQSEKRSRANASSKQQQRSTASTMKLTIGTTLAPRLHRKVVKGFAAKKTPPLAHRHALAGEVHVDPCDNSNDSGLGFDNHLEYHLVRTTVRFADQESSWTDDHPEVKRKKLEIKLESDDANEDFTFPETVSRRKKEVNFRGSTISAGIGDAGRPTTVTQRMTNANVRPVQRQSVTRPPSLTGRRNAGPASLGTQLTGVGGDGKTHLQILCQPEQQHRARYQTEGSRGAVKDRSGNGFPVVKLVGYDKPATLQVFIGTDLGRVAPHMFYQACRVSGKNSTPCVEKKIDGTIVIEVDFDPAKDMVVTCDCVGILKERNVDVEHRFPDQSGARNKKKSTRCRMVFRTTVTHDDGSTEVLQTTSQPIVCTQPPGVPEICKKSVSACPSSGGLELFILGKNFLKDTRVVFQQSDCEPHWEETVQPDKEYLQQTHLVCVVPPYRRIDIVDPVTVKLMVSSSGKMSEPHTFTYLPTTNPVVATALQVPVGAAEMAPTQLLQPALVSNPAQLSRVYGKAMPALLSGGHRQKPPTPLLATVKSQYLPAGGDGKEAVMMWPTTVLVNSKAEEPKPKLLPPPPLLPLATRAFLEPQLKTEMTDEGPEDLRTKQPLATVADLSSTQSPSMATFRQFVSDSSFLPLPAQSAHSIEKYLSHIESKEPPFAVINGLAAFADDGLRRQRAELVMRTSTEKLDALVNSAAETHMIGVAGPAADAAPAEAVLLPPPDRSPIAIKSMILEATAAPDNVILQSTDDRSPPVAVDNIMMETADLAPPIVVKQMMMDAPSTACTSPIAVKQMMMESQSTACTSPIAVKEMMMGAPSTACTSPIAVKQMMMESQSTACTSPIAVKEMLMGAPSTACTSPIAVKQMMMEAPSTACTSPIAVKQMMMDAPSTACTSPIAVKQMIMEPPSTACTSPIAVKQMMMEAPSTACTSPIAVKQMLMDAPSTACASPIAVKQMLMEAPSTACTSPIAVKQMMMDAPSTACTSPIAVKQMMMGAPSTACTSPIAIKTMLLGGNGPPLDAGTLAIKDILNSAPAETSSLCSLIAPAAPPAVTASPPTAANATLLDAVYASGGDSTRLLITTADKIEDSPQITAASTAPLPAAPVAAASVQKKCEEGMLPQELTQMSDNDLISYINPSCFDAV